MPTPAASAFLDTIVPNPTVVDGPGAQALDLVVGGSFTGALTIGSGGTMANTDGNLGFSSGSIGTATVSGARATWTNSGDLYVGRNATGTLNINSGGTVSNTLGTVGGCSGCSTDAFGTVTVNGTGSTWTNSVALVVGYSGTGKVTISNGGKVLTGSAGGFLGNSPGSTGTMTVTDVGSTWNIGGQLVVGGYLGPALGALTVQNGGTVTNTESNVGYASGSTGTTTVGGAGATWTNSGDLYIGRNGTGTLNIGSAGTVSNAVGRIGGCDGCSTSAVGTVTVSGATWTNSIGLAVGDSGTGQVTISGGGQVLTGSAGGFLGNRSGSAGTMTVTDAGSAWNNSGQLVVGGYLGPALGTLTVQNGGTVTNTEGTIGYSSGSTGAVSVTGTGSTWSNSGNVDVGRAGTGALTVGSGGVVNVAGGTGTIVVAGQAGSIGTLNVGAAPGDTAAAPGTLNAAAVQFGAGTGALNFNHTASDHVFAPTITGAGSVNVLAGTTIFTGANTYTGSTTVSGGKLVVNGSLASAVTVNGGTLQSSGTIGGPVTVNAGGTVAPGNSIGTLNVSGNFSQSAGSTYTVEVNAAGQSDRINVTGTATLGGAVAVQAQSGNYARNTSYTILTAGGINGTYSNVTSNFAFLTPSLGYSSTAVTLMLVSGANSFQNGAQTPNQRAVGAALDQANSTASGDFNTVLNALYGLDTTQGPRALDAIGGQIYSGFASLQVQLALLFMDSFSSRAGGSAGVGGATLSGGGTYRALKVDDCDNACDIEPLWGAWGGGLGAFGTVAGDSNGHGLTYNLGGFIAGLDRRFMPGFRAGIAAGFNAASLYAQGMPGYGTSNALQFALYGEYRQDAFHLDALAGYGHSDNRMTRPIVIPGLPFRSAQGDTTANTFFGQLEAGYKIAVVPSIGGFVTPFARLQASTSTQAGFSETGADSLNLTVAQQTTQALRTVLGAQVGAAVDAPWHEKLDLALRLGWSHEFADLSRPVTASFAGAPAVGFTTFGAQAPRDGVVLGLGANTRLAERTGVYFRYDGDLAGANSNHILSAGIRYVW